MHKTRAALREFAAGFRWGFRHPGLAIRAALDEYPAEPGAETAAGPCTDPADGADTASSQHAGYAAPALAPPRSPSGGARVTPDSARAEAGGRG